MRADDSLCTGCSLCAQVCSMLKYGEVNEARSAIRIARDPFEGWERVLVCSACEGKGCIEACSPRALEAVNGGIRVDRGACSLCLACVEACPYGAVHVARGGMGGRPLSIEICDGCGGEYPCVPFCTTGAIAP